MKKLTKEQADYLKTKLKDYFRYLPEGMAGMHSKRPLVVPGDIEKMINQFTEKEFPEFNNFNIQIIWAATDEDNYGIRLSLGQTERSLLPSQFKEFTQACNKVVEWREEQEDE